MAILVQRASWKMLSMGKSGLSQVPTPSDLELLAHYSSFRHLVFRSHVSASAALSLLSPKESQGAVRRPFVSCLAAGLFPIKGVEGAEV